MKKQVQVISKPNQKTGEIRFRARFTWVDANGKRRDSKTGWHHTYEEAEADGIEKKKRRLLEAKNESADKYYQTIPSAMMVWIEELRQKAERTTTENTTTDKSKYNRARTVYKKYIPKDIEKTRIRDINENTFRSWLIYINSLNLSGITVRNYKTVLIGFNQYLGNNKYYEDPDLDRRIDITLSRTAIKGKHTGEKQNRRTPNIQDLYNITDYYYLLGLGEFKNLYWYTLWFVLFFGGMRISELIGLQWKFIDLERDTIDIRNSISEREIKSNVISRVSQEAYHTKNRKSERIIPIFAIYRRLLFDYKGRFKSHFELTDKEVQDCFVFPLVLQTKEDLYDYQKQKNILRELNRVCEIQNIDKYEVAMFRHGTATWMVSDVEDGGLGFTESQAKDYFGHTTNAMIEQTYARLDKERTARRTITTFSSLMENRERKEPKEITILKELSKLVMIPELNEEEIERARQDRIADEIDRVNQYKFDDYDFADVMQVCVNAYKNGIDLDRVELIWMHQGEEIRMNEVFRKASEGNK